MSHETDCISGIIHHISVSCGNGRFEIVFFKSVGIYYRIEKLFIIYIEKLASLLDEINRINTDDKENDIIGRVYEYFLSKFALAEGKGKGEFYTPKCIVNLIAEMLEPYDGILYDPCCGSGGMFVQSIKFVEAHSGNKKKISIYGQEYTNTTFKLAKMNLAIRGIAANLGEMVANTFKILYNRN